MPDVSIAFIGDVFLGETPSISLADRVGDLLRAADWVVANQEAPITTSTEPVGGKICLKSNPVAAQVLRDWGCDTVSLANNHVFDYGYKGFKDTQHWLDDAGISYLGGGKDLAEATKPLIVDVKGLTLGFIAHSCAQAETTCATEQSFGCAPLDDELMIAAVGRLKRDVDAVIVLPHWGYCDYHIPNPGQVSLGNRLLDAGATAVVGHHSHVVQGVVRRGAQLIAYSLGNFAFAPISVRGRVVAPGSEHQAGAVLTLRLAGRDVVAWDVEHTVNENGTVDVDDQRDRARVFARRTASLTSGNYGRIWRRAVRWRMVKRMLHWLNVLNWRHVRAATLYGGWVMIKELLGAGSKRRR